MLFMTTCRKLQMYTIHSVKYYSYYMYNTQALVTELHLIMHNNSDSEYELDRDHLVITN